jgi:mRNA degradation ribonuclease J1/J2
VPGKYVFIKSASAVESVPATQQPRKQPANPATVVVNLSLDKRTNRLLDTPEITTKNIVSAGIDTSKMAGAVQKRVVEVIHSGVRVERDISDVVRTFVFNQTKCRPNVSVNITRA